MPSYSNGYIPDDLLVTFAEGANTVDGSWKHQLSPGTYAKHLALVKRSPGGRLQVSPGWGAYRPYSAQIVARRIYGNGAAVPGTSSHGGFWEGRQTLAIDYHNWGSVYGWDQVRFFADCRAVGLTPGMIMRSRGYPDEPWHVIDLDPWAPAPAGLNVGVFNPQITSEEDEMNVVLYLYVPTNNLLLVDHMNKTIRELGNKTTFVRDYYSRKPYIKAYDAGDSRIKPLEGDVAWQQVVSGYVYVTKPNVEGTPATIDPVKVAEAVVAGLKASGGVTVPSAEEIAKAVNDDAARRLAS
jgi:hypothetical protein